ncbi:hypothetical protein GCM10010923_02460 [Blastomonas marina]|uniref:Uncharacterized protein n=1 Tax=Blastomonas marina TaxID=1867408 RepID=A0ABQ1F2D1_9SPHN|nr:hypothetical protein GCM10010923_02460 [Blastomonas marina]
MGWRQTQLVRLNGSSPPKPALDRLDHCSGDKIFPHQTLPWIVSVDRLKAACRDMTPVYRIAAK